MSATPWNESEHSPFSEAAAHAAETVGDQSAVRLDAARV